MQGIHVRWMAARGPPSTVELLQAFNKDGNTFLSGGGLVYESEVVEIEGSTQCTGEASPSSRRNDGSLRAFYPKLRVGRRGRDGPTDDEVASHQRARLYGAMVRAVAAQGYGATTVRQLSALAGVSTRTLYELFSAGKQECFFSAYDAAIRRMARRVAVAYISERDRERRLARALEAFACEVRDEPQAARLILLEVFAAGPAALERMEYAQRLFEGMVALSFRQTAGGLATPPLLVKGVVAGGARVARVHLLAGRERELPALTGELLEWALSYRSSAAATLESLVSTSGPVVAPAAVSTARGQRGDDHARILDAVAQLAARDGYETLTAAGIAAAAGLSRKRFTAHFEDVPSCFMAAVEHLTNCALADAAIAGAAGPDWPGGVHRALSALCAYIAADPLFARLAFVEVFALGPDGVRFREAGMARFIESFRASAPGAQRPSRLAAEASVGAIWGVVHHHVANGAINRLPTIAPQLSFLALAPALGAQGAVSAILAEDAQTRALIAAA
jgi:AcrR family transcriptional regulator